MIWSPLTMTLTDDHGRVIGKIEEIEKPDPYNDEFTVMKYSATFIRMDGTCIGVDLDSWEEAQAFIERYERKARLNAQRIAAE